MTLMTLKVGRKPKSSGQKRVKQGNLKAAYQAFKTWRKEQKVQTDILKKIDALGPLVGKKVVCVKDCS